ncbi:DMT family transporter [Sphingobium xenophagum]|mgnify:CR=1 FL=1|uniref:DMT family transporter n=1 Tax=Sphingobium xenophagum TaxID=121428 RepID=UPI0036D3B354|tara:strand:+ start:2409 stop:3338 length:930 start_codon:yes stop_codon:yes gene_type:complete
MIRHSQVRLVIYFCAIVLIMGSTWLVIRDQVSQVPPDWSITWRFLIATVGMIVLAAIRRDSLWMTAEGMRLALLVGLFNYLFSVHLVYRAARYLPSGLIAVFFALLLVPSALLARVFLKTQLTQRFLLGSGVAVIGISLLLLHEYRVSPPDGSVLLGVVLCLGALLFASVASVLQASAVARRQRVVPVMVWAMVWATLANSIFAWLSSGPPVFDTRPQYLIGLAYLAIAASVVTAPLTFVLIQHWGPGRAAYSGVAVPVVAMILSTLFEGYRWSSLAASGAILAILGLLVALSGRAHTSAPSPKAAGMK